MRTTLGWIALAAAAAAGGCSWFGWRGYQTPRQTAPGPQARPPASQSATGSRETSKETVPPSVSPSVTTPRPEKFTDEEMNALYYYDLGPKTIDVGRYPAEQRYNYGIFARACAQCHALARPINSPRSSFWAWRYYIFNMRMRSRFSSGTSLSEEEGRRILDFLTYDALIRKEENRDDFEETTRRLERRFDDILAERVRRAMEGMPAPRRRIEMKTGDAP